MSHFIAQHTQVVRSYYTGIGKTKVIYVAAFFVAVAVTMVNLGVVLVAKDKLNVPPATIGWVGSMWAVAYAFGCLVVRPVFGRLLPRYLITLSNLCMALVCFAILHVSSIAWLLVLCALYGMAMGLFWPPIMGWLSTNSEGSALGRLIAKFNMSWVMGAVISPYLWGTLSERDVTLPILCAGIMLILNTAFVGGAALVLPKAPSECAQDEPDSTEAPVIDQSTPLRFPAWVGAFATFFGLGVLSTVFILEATANMGFPASTIGLLFLIRTLINGVTFVVLGKALFWHFRVWPMIVAQLLSAAVFVMLTVAGTSFLALAFLFAVYGITGGLSYVTSVFHGVSGSVARARRMATHEVLLALGMAGGAVIGAELYEATSMDHVYVLCAAILVLSALIQIALSGMQRRSRAFSKSSHPQ